MRRQLIAMAAGAVLALSACGASDAAGPTTAIPVTESTPESASSPAVPNTTSSTTTSSSGTTTNSTYSSEQGSTGVSATSATTSATTVATTSATTVATAGGADPNTGGSAGSSDQASTADSVDPTEPDEATISWFDSFCTGAVTITDSESRLAELDPDFSDPEIAQADYADLLVEVGTRYNDFAADLSTQPPPSIPGGESTHSALVDGFSGLGAAYLNAAEAFGSASVNDEAGYNAAVFAAQTTIAAAKGVLNAQFDTVTADLSGQGEQIQASVRSIPSCQQAFGAG